MEWCRRRISSLVYNPIAPNVSILPCRGGGSAKKQQILLSALLCALQRVCCSWPCSEWQGACATSESWFPCPHFSTLQVKCTAELCWVESWWLRLGLLRNGCVVFISLKQGHLCAMRDRSTTHRAKTASELWRKYIVISLCKGTIKFCIEFKAKRTRGNNNTLWMLFHHSATLIVCCFTICLLLEMLLTVNELPLKGFYHHIPFKCLRLELLP